MPERASSLHIGRPPGLSRLRLRELHFEPDPRPFRNEPSVESNMVPNHVDGVVPGAPRAEILEAHPSSAVPIGARRSAPCWMTGSHLLKTHTLLIPIRGDEHHGQRHPQDVDGPEPRGWPQRRDLKGRKMMIFDHESGHELMRTPARSAQLLAAVEDGTSAMASTAAWVVRALRFSAVTKGCRPSSFSRLPGRPSPGVYGAGLRWPR